MMRFFRKHIIWSNVLLILFLVMLAVVAWRSGDWFFAGSVETWGPLHTYGFIWLSIIIATIAAINAIFATTLANETQRPWLHMIGGTIKAYERMDRYTVLPFTFSNSGSLPATSVDFNVDFFSHSEKVTEDNNSSVFEVATKGDETSMVLPNDTYTQEYIFDIQNENDHKLLDCIKQGKVKVRFRTSYESFGRKHLIIQTFELSKRSWEEKLSLIPIPPQKWK